MGALDKAVGYALSSLATHLLCCETLSRTLAQLSPDWDVDQRDTIHGGGPPSVEVLLRVPRRRRCGQGCGGGRLPHGLSSDDELLCRGVSGMGAGWGHLG